MAQLVASVSGVVLGGVAGSVDSLYPSVYIYMGLVHFWRFKILNFNIFCGFQKNDHSWGYEDFVNIFGSHHKTGAVLWVVSMHFRVFLKEKVQNGIIFGGLLKGVLASVPTHEFSLNFA